MTLQYSFIFIASLHAYRYRYSHDVIY